MTGLREAGSRFLIIVWRLWKECDGVCQFETTSVTEWRISEIGLFWKWLLFRRQYGEVEMAFRLHLELLRAQRLWRAAEFMNR